jgi:hypothetical protein
MKKIIPIILLGLAAAPQTSFGHAAWKLGGTTPPRSSDMGLKDTTGNNGCGSPTLVRGNNPVTLVVGQQLKLQWTEYIYHKGSYRVTLSPSGQVNAEFENPANFWYQGVNSTDTVMPKQFEQTITVPNTPCSNCTLQFTQYMSDTGTNYFSCSDIIIVPAGPVPSPTPVVLPSPNCAK